jgi:branched-chain amino acid transport system permease protein
MAVFCRRNVMRTLLLLAAIIPVLANAYELFIANLVLIYVILAIGLNVLVGSAGQLSFANAAMFGIGAYGTALLQVHLGWPFYLALPAGTGIAITIGLLMSLPALRLSGLYLALSTLAFAQFSQWVLLHWEDVTFGAGGFKSPPISFEPIHISKAAGLYYLSLAGAAGFTLFAQNLIASRIGRAFVAVRDGDIAAQSLGVSLLRYKALAFGVSGFAAGLAGGLYSQLLNFVSPEGFDLFQMVLQKAMIVVGGLGSVAGSVLGAGSMIVLLELLREVKGAQEVVFGGLLILFVIVFRGGIAGLLRRHVAGWEEPLHAVSAMRAPRAVAETPLDETEKAR